MQQQKVVVFSDGLFFKPNLTENELGNCMSEIDLERMQTSLVFFWFI